MCCIPKAFSVTSTTADRWPRIPVWRRHRAEWSIDREQGVSKAGNPRLRSTMVELAWLWTRHQPESALSKWFQERAKIDSRRKVTIVALARKLLVALWKYVTAGVMIEGAVMKSA